jgi:hypothetical protein
MAHGFSLYLLGVRLASGPLCSRRGNFGTEESRQAGTSGTRVRVRTRAFLRPGSSQQSCRIVH